jgi:hypothetical protein
VSDDPTISNHPTRGTDTAPRVLSTSLGTMILLEINNKNKMNKIKSITGTQDFNVKNPSK